MKIVSAPNPQWTPGDRVASPVNEMVSLDPATLDMPAKYRLLVDTIIPRPIAFISTLSENGTVNVAPYSFFNGVSSNPPAIMFSIAFKADGTKKDTLRNIEQTGEFVVNTVGEWMAEAMNHCSADYPYGVSEVAQVGLTSIPSLVVAPPRIKESPVHLECRLIGLHQVGQQEAGAATVVIGEIVRFHIHKPALISGRVLAEELKPIARLGGVRYAALESAFELPRPQLTAEACNEKQRNR
jgi:flavin reductase (DIM6/NTAB) family NADH-FMN oxidoreductase RutF